jgi:signal peptidase I
VTDAIDSADSASDRTEASGPSGTPEEKKKPSALREFTILLVIVLAVYYVVMTFVARPYLIPSESMEPTLHGCAGCVGDRIMVDKVVYHFGAPRPGDVVVFKGPPSWNLNYRSIRSDNPVKRGLQNTLAFLKLLPPDENDLVKRVIAVGGQTVQCRADTGLTVDGKPLTEPYLDPRTLGADPAVHRCLGLNPITEFGPVKVPEGRLWVMGDNRTHSADSRAHCASLPADSEMGVSCTGDPVIGTIPVENVIGKARFIAWPPSRWGGVKTTDPQGG